MKIKYIACDGTNVIEEKIDNVEFYSYTLDGEERQSILCKRSKDNELYKEHDEVFSNFFEVPVEKVFTIN